METLHAPPRKGKVARRTVRYARRRPAPRRLERQIRPLHGGPLV